MSASPSWVVLKFGGTSVSSRIDWDQIVTILPAREAESGRILLVHSGLSGVTDALSELLDYALASLVAGRKKHERLFRPAGSP